MMPRTRKPIVPAPEQPRGKVTVLEERCKGCGFCVEFCPKDVLELSKKINAKGYHFPQVKNAESCVNCQLCYYLCPEFAIFVTELKNNAHGTKGSSKQAKGTSVENVGGGITLCPTAALS